MKKFFEKLKNVFKNKKIFTAILVSVLGLSTLGTGLGIFIQNEILRGGEFQQTENPREENDTHVETSSYWDDRAYGSGSLPGSGTQSDPYQISDGWQLASLINYSTYNYAYYVITQDIDLYGAWWVPIGKKAPFTGCIDGQGHTISTLVCYLKNPYDDNGDNVYNVSCDGNRINHYFAFIGCATNAIIKNLNFDGLSMTTDSGSTYNPYGNDGYYYKYAGIVASATSNVQIYNCHVNDLKINPQFYHDFASEFWVGGIAAGLHGGSTITNCSVSNANFNFSGGNKTANNNQCVGGLVGDSAGKIQESSFTYAEFDVSSVSSVGLICGQMTAGSGIIEDCYSSDAMRGSRISVSSYFFGGIVADANGGSIVRRCCSYSSGSNVTLNCDLIGGIVGETSCKVVSCFSALNIGWGAASFISGNVGAIASILYSGGEVYSCGFYYESNFTAFTTAISYVSAGSEQDNFSVSDTSLFQGNRSFYTSTEWLARGKGSAWDFDYTWTDIDMTLYIVMPTLRGSNIGNVNFDANGWVVQKNYVNEPFSIPYSQTGHNLKIDFDPTTGEYKLQNLATDDPYATIGETAYLTAGETYYMHVTLSSAAGKGVRIYYAINQAYNDPMSLQFTAIDSEKSFTPTQTGTYNFRFDNDVGVNIMISNFSVYQYPGGTTASYNFSRKDIYQGVLEPEHGSEYVFDGWYQKKNYLTDEIIMDLVNKWKVSGDDIEYKGGILYLNANNSANSYSFSAPQGRYRITYLSRYQDFTGSNYGSTLVPTINTVESYDTVKSPLLTDSASWKKHTSTFTTTSDTIYLYFSQDYGGSEVKDITIERVDVDDFVGEPFTGTRLCANQYGDKGYAEIVNLYAKYSLAQYTLMIEMADTDSWTTAPSVSVTAGGATQTLLPGPTNVVSFSFDFYSYSQDVKFVAPGYYLQLGNMATGGSSFGELNTSCNQSEIANETIHWVLYAAQGYTVSFDDGYADWGPPTPDPMYKIHVEGLTLPENELMHFGFSANGWNTSPDGKGASYTTYYTENADVTLYPNWTPVEVKFNIEIITLDLNGNEISETGGKINATRWFALNNQAASGTATSSYTSLVEYESVITATPNVGYIFLGFNITRDKPYSQTAPSEVFSYTPTGAGDMDIYVYFRQISANKLKYDSKEQYWYFEDGEYPQSEVDSELSAMLDSQSFSAASYTLQYNNGAEIEVPVYEFDSDLDEKVEKYAQVIVNGVSKWFVVEPIRWRVSAYGVGEDVKPSIWENYGDTRSLVAASEKILFASIMTADRIDDSKPTNSANFWLNKYVSTAEFQLKYDGESLRSQDSFAGAGGQDVTQSGTVNTNVAVYSDEHITLSDQTAKLTAFASFLLYGTTAYADTFDTYWTRDLQTTEGRSEYGCGVVVTSYGSETLRWLNQMCGVRLSYYCTEVSRY